MLSSLPACRSIVGCAAPSLTALMQSCCFEHCSLGCEGSRACAPWCRFQTPPMRMPDGVFGERIELISERVGLTNRIGAVLATLGVSDYNPLLRSRNRRLAELRTGLGEPLPRNAHAKIERLLARLELVLTQIAELERERDAVVETEASDKASKMIQQLTSLRGIGVQSATVLVREAFVRRFANGKTLGSYAGLASSPFSSGGVDREQGIGKAGNRRVRAVMVEPAWLWIRYQPASCSGLLVPRKGWIDRTACSKNHGGGSKTADRAVEVRRRRSGA